MLLSYSLKIFQAEFKRLDNLPFQHIQLHITLNKVNCIIIFNDLQCFCRTLQMENRLKLNSYHYLPPFLKCKKKVSSVFLCYTYGVRYVTIIHSKITFVSTKLDKNSFSSLVFYKMLWKTSFYIFLKIEWHAHPNHG